MNVFQKDGGVFIQDLQQEAGALGGVAGHRQAGSGRRHRQDRRILQGDGDQVVGGQDHAERQGVIVIGAAHDRDVRQDEHALLFDFDTGAFFFVQGGPDEIFRHARRHEEGTDFVGRGIDQADPGILDQLVARHGLQHMVNRFEYIEHERRLLLTGRRNSIISTAKDAR